MLCVVAVVAVDMIEGDRCCVVGDGNDDDNDDDDNVGLVVDVLEEEDDDPIRLLSSFAVAGRGGTFL
jgi:hypothetical protein